MSCRFKSRVAGKPVILRLITAICVTVLLQVTGKMTTAQTQQSLPILVQCNAASDVPSQTQEMLCAGLQTALSTKYPALLFAPSADKPDRTSTSVTLQTFVANAYGMELRLNWRTPDRGNGEGPRLGFSIVDKAMTADMQLKFLNRVVQDTALPF